MFFDNLVRQEEDDHCTPDGLPESDRIHSFGPRLLNFDEAGIFLMFATWTHIIVAAPEHLGSKSIFAEFEKAHQAIQGECSTEQLLRFQLEVSITPV